MKISEALVLLQSDLKITTLTLNPKGKISKKLFNQLCSTIAEHSTLKEITLDNISLTMSNCHWLADALQKNNTITHLSLENCDIDCNGVTSLVKILRNNDNLLLLNLNNNQIKTAGAKAIADALLINNELNYLYLAKNDIGVLGVLALAQTISRTNSIVNFDISYNNFAEELTHIKEKGHYIVDLEEALKYLLLAPSLCQLNLSGNPLPHRFEWSKAPKVYLNIYHPFKLLAKCLQKNHTLEQLSLDNNRICKKDATFLAKAIKNNHHLNELSLINNAICNKGFISLTKALKHNTSLTSINVKRNGIRLNGINALSHVLENDNNTLLSFSGPCASRIQPLLDRNASNSVGYSPKVKRKNTLSQFAASTSLSSLSDLSSSFTGKSNEYLQI